jgi:hypothetical protein
MRTFLADRERNVPLPVVAFPRTDKRSVCPQCNFFELCRPEICRELCRDSPEPAAAEAHAG